MLFCRVVMHLVMGRRFDFFRTSCMFTMFHVPSGFGVECMRAMLRAHTFWKDVRILRVIVVRVHDSDPYSSMDWIMDT